MLCQALLGVSPVAMHEPDDSLVEYIKQDLAFAAPLGSAHWAVGEPSAPTNLSAPILGARPYFKAAPATKNGAAVPDEPSRGQQERTAAPLARGFTWLHPRQSSEEPARLASHLRLGWPTKEATATKNGTTPAPWPLPGSLGTVELRKTNPDARLGVSVSEKTDAARGRVVVVSALQPGCVAERSGLQVGDIILEVDGQSPKSPTHCTELVKKAQGKATLLVERPLQVDRV